ncbi:MAG: sensor histidine kinase [Chloroflexi bacterium]|nr:sensor histidine kinase [Chloroflexota bacterium]
MLDFLGEFLEVNSVLVWFVYGLMFFVLGLAITLRSRAHSRLELARHLVWLAAFGFLHGLNEWGDLFIPIQATYLPTATINFLYTLQTFLLAASFAVLFQFGAELLHDRWPALRVLPVLISLGWLVWFLIAHINLYGDMFAHQELSSAWASYLIGFPGALLSAIGLHYQVQKQIKPLHLKKIERPFLIASYALVAYALADGLIVPASWLNNDTIVAALGVTPPVLRSIIGLTLTISGLTLAISVFRALDVFQIEVERLIERLQVERELIYERDRIGRELHDGAIQTIYTAGLLVETATRKLDPESELAQPLERAGKAINEAIADLRAFIGGLRPLEVPQSLRQALAERAADSQLAPLVDIDWDLDLPEDINFQATRIPHVLGILNEALSNAIRHAGARHVRVQASRPDNRLELVIEDDGRGFDKQNDARGFGLRNIQDRARLLDGTLHIQSQPGTGTKIVLSAPWELKL